MSIWFNQAGLIGFCWSRYALHFCVKPSHWVWGYDDSLEYWHLKSYGLGPLFLFVADCT
jgi:hypothetical protein